MSTGTEIRDRRDKIPWIIVCLLVIVFFFGTHHYDWLITGVPDSTASDVTGQITEGSPLRRLLFSALGISGILLFLISRRRGRISLSLPGRFFLIYLCWAFLSVTWSIEPVLTIRRLILFSMCLFFALGLSRYISNRSFVAVVFLCTTIILLIGVFVEVRSNTINPLITGYRFSGTLHPNLQAVNCALLVFSGAVLFRLSQHHRIAISVVTAGGFLFLLMTRSRASFAALLFSFILYALLASSIPRKVVYTLLFIVAVGLLALSSNAFEVLLNDVILMGRHDDTTGTLVGRVPLWEDCLAYAAERPILGYGFCTFWTESHVQEFEARHGWAPKSAHSVYLEVLLSLGLIGSMLFFLSVMFGTRLTFVRGAKLGRFEDVFLFYVLVFGLFHGLLESTVLFANFQDFSTFIALNVMLRMGAKYEDPRGLSAAAESQSPIPGT